MIGSVDRECPSPPTSGNVNQVVLLIVKQAENIYQLDSEIREVPRPERESAPSEADPNEEAPSDEEDGVPPVE